MVKIKKIILVTHIIVLSLMNHGCLNLLDVISEFEHENNIEIEFDDNHYRIIFSQNLDSETIPFFNPDDKYAWEYTLDSNKVYLTYKNTFKYDGNPISLFQMDSIPDSSLIENHIFSSVFNKELIMDKLLEIHTNHSWIFDGFKIKGSRSYKMMTSFKARSLVPGLKIILNSDDEDVKVEDIVNEIVGTLYVETLNHSNIENTLIPEILNDLKTNNTLNISEYLDEYSSFTNLDTLLNDAQTHLIKSVEKIASEHIDNVGKIWTDKKIDLYITLLLVFKEFEITATMPGEIIFHNSDSTHNNSLQWKFDIIDLSNGSYPIFAESRVIQNNNSESAIWAAISVNESKNSINIYMIVVVVILIIILTILNKRKK